MTRKHLDLGCGARPRNTFHYEELYGVDIRADIAESSAAKIVAANLSTSPIPFGDNSFDSVSAYDFFEHIPRVAIDYAHNTSRFPFIELMNEVWRILKPDGVLYAVTPAFPHEAVFRDPTHVNFITKRTHIYFTEPYIEARMYGFIGRFRLVRQCKVCPREEYEPISGSIGHQLQRLRDKLTGRQSHLVWEFSAIK